VNLGDLALNLLLIALVPLGGLLLGRRQDRTANHTGTRTRLGAGGGALLAGAIAAISVIVALLAARPYLPSRTVPRLAVVAAAEELARIAAVLAVWRSGHREASAGGYPRGPARGQSGKPLPEGILSGVLVGAGFVTIENLLYLLIPPPLLLTRLVTAGAVHLACGGLYGYALARRYRSGGTGGSGGTSGGGGGTRIPRDWILPAALTLGVAGHLAYNLLARTLDQILILW
jgi:RsiW-degrading membrane proteinase PrsW (M82 family)